MSIIRLSLLRDGIYIPDERGNIEIPDQLGSPGTPAEINGENGGDFGFRGILTPARKRLGQGRLDLFPRGTLPKPNGKFAEHIARSLAWKAADLPPDAPVVVMVHGFQFDPAVNVVRPPHHHKADNPHARIYHFEEHPEDTEIRHHSTSWPRRLGFAESDQGADGLCIAFGWYSNPGFFSSFFEHGKNFYAKAYEEAEVAAWQLTALLDVLAANMPGRQIDIFCHSLGSRVVLRAFAQAVHPLPRLAPAPPVERVIRAVDRVLLLAGAEKVLEAQLALGLLNGWCRQDAGGDKSILPTFYNFMSRENDVLDVLAENFGPAAPGSKQVIGHNGLEGLDPAWVDIQLDDPEVGHWFARHPGNYTISGNNTQIFAVLDHWIHYTWRENMRVYRDILRKREDWNIADLKQEEDGRIFNRIRLMRDKSSGRANLTIRD